MKLWQVLVLILVGVLTAAGGYFGYNRFLGKATAKESSNTTTVQVARGTLATTVSTTGSLVMPNQAKLSFASGGTVTEMNVKLGDKVQKGQVLAKLDTSSLERAVEQARINLSTAEINLDEAKNPNTASDIADAEAAVRDAQVALDNARRNLQITQQGLTTQGVPPPPGRSPIWKMRPIGMRRTMVRPWWITKLVGSIRRSWVRPGITW